jgi:hypothetical protein
MAPFFPPETHASAVELGRVICAKPERKITHLMKLEDPRPNPVECV